MEQYACGLNFYVLLLSTLNVQQLNAGLGASLSKLYIIDLV
jgi:hypothetical protein